MAAIADAIDFLSKECLSGRLSRTEKSPAYTNLAGSKALLYICYGVTLSFLAIVKDFASEPGLPDFSFVCFLGSTLQFLGFFSLCMKVKGTKSVSGISSQSLVMFAINLACRVFVTSTYEGYLPADKTGDFMLQIVDVATLGLVVYTLYHVHKVYVHSYQQEQDALSIQWILASCAVSAFFLHAELNNCPFFDTIWAFGMNVEIFQMLPQLYMLSKLGGRVENETTHYVVLTFFSCVCRFMFWLWAIPGCIELSSPDGYAWNMEIGGYYILVAYILELCVHLDFMYYFVKAWWQGSSVRLPASEDI